MSRAQPIPSETPVAPPVVQEQIQTSAKDTHLPGPVTPTPVVKPESTPAATPISLTKPEQVKVEPPLEARRAEPQRPAATAPVSPQRQSVNAKKPFSQIVPAALPTQKFGFLTMGILLLLGAGAAYYLWQKYAAVTTEQEPVASQTGVAIPVMHKKEKSQERGQQAEHEPVVQPQEAEATVEPPARPEPIEATAPTSRTESPSQGAQPSTEPRNTAMSKPAPVRESGLSQSSPTGTSGTQEKSSPKPAPKVEAKPAPVDEIIAQECAKEKGFKRVICEEKVRFKLCDGQWGMKPGCPKYEHEDPFKF